MIRSRGSLESLDSSIAHQYKKVLEERGPRDYLKMIMGIAKVCEYLQGKKSKDCIGSDVGRQIECGLYNCRIGLVPSLLSTATGCEFENPPELAQWSHALRTFFRTTAPNGQPPWRLLAQP